MTLPRTATGALDRTRAPWHFTQARQHDSDFVLWMARTLWADYWASNAEERGRSIGGDILDSAPTTPRWAYVLARDLSRSLQLLNIGRTLDSVLEEWAALVDAARISHGEWVSGWKGRGTDVETFAHYAAMTFLGHGVGLWEIHGFDCDARFPFRGESYPGARFTGGPAAGLNLEQRLYVIPCGEGFSTLGFDYAENRARAVIAWLDLEVTGAAVADILAGHRIPAQPGTLEALAQYRAALAAAKAHFDATGRRCPVDLVPALVGLEGLRVEVVDCYGETRRFQVGKSTGWIPCHLEISSSRSTGGGPVYGAPFKSVTVIR